MSVKAERDKQETKIRALYDYLKARTGQWVSLPELAGAIHSECGSTKISQARKYAKAENAEIVWNRNSEASCYMLRPTRLGRDAAEPARAPWDQDRPFAEPFKLS